MKMSDPSNPPRIDEPQTGFMPSAARNEWNPSDVDVPPQEPAVVRERIFPRKVLIGWALFALALYFGVRTIGSVIKSSLRESITAVERVDAGGNPSKEIIYRTKNGRITISRDHPGGPIKITRESSTPAAAPTAVPAATPATAPPAPPPAKR
jgi:hypothetical protein